MTNPHTEQSTGLGLRRRVRALTLGVTGAAVLATVGVTATMAYAQFEKTSDGSATGVDGNAVTGVDGNAVTGVDEAGDADGWGGSSSSAGSATSPYAGRLAAPVQPPTLTGNFGHAGSGGS